jgi:hypothetical protein
MHHKYKHSFGELVDCLQLSHFPFSLTKLSLIIYIRKYLNGLPFWHSALEIYSISIAKGNINIPLFAILIKRINIASFCICQARQIKEEEEMRFIKCNQQYKTSGMQPILLLVPEWLELDNKDKMTFITFNLKVRAGTGAGTPSYKKHMWTFDKGTPQEWMELLTGLRKIWQQNSVNGAHDRAVTVAAVLKGNSQPNRL